MRRDEFGIGPSNPVAWDASTHASPASRPLPEDTPFHVVLNTGSGSLETDERINTIHAVLKNRRHELVQVRDPRHLADAARQAIAWAQRHQGAVVVAGGDGTVNALAQHVLPTGLPFGVLPQGTFNYFARAHGIPTDMADAARALLTARVQPVQVGLVNDRVFLVNGSMGLYPQVLQDREAFKKRFGRTRPVAFLAALSTLLSQHRTWVIKLEIDGQVKTMVTPTLFVGNNALQFEQIGIAEAPMLQADQLVALMVKPQSRLAMLGLLLRGALGRLGEADQVTSLAFHRLTIEPRLPHKPRQIEVATDGEITRMSTPLRFQPAAQQLQLLVPE